LRDLQHRDVLLPPDAHAARRLKVVPVHDHVHGQIKCDGDPGHGGVANKLGVAEQSSGAVVIGVKEGQRFLLKNKEYRVDEFDVFGNVVELWSVRCTSQPWSIVAYLRSIT
jgi:hypothetical protein